MDVYCSCRNATDLMVGGDFEGELSPAACPLGGTFAL